MSIMPHFEVVRGAGGDIIDKLTEACKFRTISRTSDQTFCLVSIVGFDIQSIVEAPTHEDKMRIFLLQIKHLPKGVIFFEGRKLGLNTLPGPLIHSSILERQKLSLVVREKKHLAHFVHLGSPRSMACLLRDLPVYECVFNICVILSLVSLG